MIASPSDVVEERKIAREVIEKWNQSHAKTEQIILLAVGWEDAYPESGESGQDVINFQMLNDSDLLIGIFGTKLGMPTTKHPSGSVGEIKDHIKAGKKAMIYFSDKPIYPSQIDSDQFEQVKSFKSEAKQHQLGLYDTFKSEEEFRIKLNTSLAQMINNHFKSALTSHKELFPLTEEQKKYLQFIRESGTGGTLVKHIDGVIRLTYGNKEIRFDYKKEGKSSKYLFDLITDIVNKGLLEELGVGNGYGQYRIRPQQSTTSENINQESSENPNETVLSKNAKKYLLNAKKGPIALNTDGKSGTLTYQDDTRQNLNHLQLTIFLEAMRELTENELFQRLIDDESEPINGIECFTHYSPTFKGYNLADKLNGEISNKNPEFFKPTI